MRGCAGAATLNNKCHRLRSVQFLVPPGSRERCEARCSNSRSGGLRAHKGSITAPLDFIPLREAIDRATRKGGLLRRFRLPPSLCELRRTQSLVELRRDKPLLAKIVILRHRVSPSASPMTGSSGVSSTLRLLDFIIDASEYWIAAFEALNISPTSS